MTPHQWIAIKSPCYFAFETTLKKYGWKDRDGLSYRLIVNTGYECIEKAFGAPVWHASVSYTGAGRPIEKKCQNILRGVGNSYWEWVEKRRKSFLMWRLTTLEEREAYWLEMTDLRNTEKGRRRLESFCNAPRVTRVMCELAREEFQALNHLRQE